VAETVEEVLRQRSTVTAVGRAAPKDFEHAGEHIDAGSTLLLSLWSANHDPAVYRRPDELAPEENRTAPHLAFGHGAHHCLGAALARAELQEALAALSARLTCPKLAAGASWKPPIGITGPETLPITFAARA
jgi:cytochrome P450